MTDTGTLESLIQQRLESDREFQSSLEEMSEDDKSAAIETKTTEFREEVFKSLGDESTKHKENYESQKVRAEKAEKGAKESPKTPEEKDLSTEDILYLAKADIHSDDMQDVRDWAKFKKTSVKEAHESLKTTLDVRQEERKTAEATNTKTGKRDTSKTSGDDFLVKAEQTGEVPENEADMTKLVEARMARVKAQSIKK